MHDLEFNHMHMAPEEVNEVAWSADNVELTTVGIDIGSSTSHLMFAQVHLQRLGTALSSRFVVVNRRIIWQSPILLTPYLSDYTIDIDELAGFIGGCYQYADLEPADIDSGAVILTGEAIKPDDRARIVTRMVRVIMSMIDLRAPNELARRLLVTDPWPAQLANKGIDALTFSGGVAEYLYKRENRRFGDLGEDLARAL